MNWKFWVKKKEEPKRVKEVIITSSLIIHMIYGDISLTAGPILNNKIVTPWKGFYKWYFNKKESPTYIRRFDGGQTIIKREYIRFFEVRKSSEVK